MSRSVFCCCYELLMDICISSFRWTGLLKYIMFKLYIFSVFFSSVKVFTPNHNECVQLHNVVGCDGSCSLTLKCGICGSTLSDESVWCRRAHISALRFITEPGRVAETISSPAGGMYHNRDDTSSLLFIPPKNASTDRKDSFFFQTASILDALLQL